MTDHVQRRVQRKEGNDASRFRIRKSIIGLLALMPTALGKKLEGGTDA
jgi:hypothetical protein